jgi:enoyl-CoA hydratase
VWAGRVVSDMLAGVQASWKRHNAGRGPQGPWTGDARRRSDGSQMSGCWPSENYIQVAGWSKYGRGRCMAKVTLERHGSVALLTVENAEVKNALTPEMGMELARLCDEIDADASIGAAVVRGAGGTFCSGADRRRWIPGSDQAEDTTYKELGAVYSAFLRVGSLKVPSVAAVRGAAVGAGMNLALATDLRVVARNARLLAGFLRIGLHPGGGFFTIATRSAGREATAAMGLFSEEIDGERAAEIGLAWVAVDDADVEDRAMQLAARTAKDPELAREAVRSFRTEAGPPGMQWDVAVHFERATQMWSQRRRMTA